MKKYPFNVPGIPSCSAFQNPLLSLGERDRGEEFNMKRSVLVSFISAAVLFAAVVLCGGQVDAQTTEESLRKELEELKKIVQEQQSRIEELTRKLDAAMKQAEERPAPVTVPPAEEEKKPEPLVGYKDGFFVKSEDGNFEAKLTQWFRAQYRSWSIGETRRDDTFSIPGARTRLDTNFLKKYRVYVDYDLATNRLFDGFVNVAFSPAFQLQMGQYKEPFGLEEAISCPTLECLYKSLLGNLVPGRDMGLMLHGKFFEGDILRYQVGIFNGVPFRREADSNRDKDFAGRLILRPFGASANETVKDLQFAASLTAGNQDLSIAGAGFSDEAGSRFFQYATGVRAYDDRARWGVGVAWPIGPCMLRSEYVTTDMGLRRSTGTMWLDEEVEMDAWYLQASWIVTGETKKIGKLLEPERPFDPSEGHWGCLELVARYSELNLDDDIFDGGYAAAGLWPGDTTGVTFGLNWGIMKQLRLSLNYVHTRYEEDIIIEGEPVTDEDAVLFGVQVVY